MNTKFKFFNILSILFFVAACGDNGSATKTGGDNKDEKAAVVAPVYLTFLEYCEQSASLKADDPLRITIDVLKSSYGGAEKTCESANTELANTDYLNFYDKAKISDLRPLAHFKRLNMIFADFQIISDLRPLEGLKNLDYLSLSGNLISDLTPLRGLLKLKNLNLYQNLITDISPLQNLTALEALFLFENSIKNIESLKGLTRLTKLYLGANPIPQQSIDDLKKALPNTSINFY